MNSSRARSRSLRVLDGRLTEREAKRCIHSALAAGKPCTVSLMSYNKALQGERHQLRIQPVFDADGWHRYTLGMQLNVDAEPRRHAEFLCLSKALPSTMGHEPVTKSAAARRTARQMALYWALLVVGLALVLRSAADSDLGRELVSHM